jgi:hypothetical protein
MQAYITNIAGESLCEQVEQCLGSVDINVFLVILYLRITLFGYYNLTVFGDSSVIRSYQNLKV